MTGVQTCALPISVGLTWGQASQALDSLSEPKLLSRWQEVQQTGSLDALDTALAQPLTSAQAAEGAVNRLLALDQTRASALSGLLYQALLVADRSAVEVRHQANVQLFRALGLVALLVLTALAAVVSVSQAIARPLRRLSAQAREISEGHLVDVDVSGLHEVQAASHVLSSMAHNLRRIEGQSAAVASGDLSNPLLEEPLPGPLGEVVHSSVARIVTAVREREVLQAELTRAATHDALTGLANRPRLLAETESALEHRELGGPMPGLLFIDLDGFKAVNDTLGHAAGDQLLTVVARRLETCARDGDLVARLGGDEFVLLITRIGHLADAVAIADRLIDRVSRPITLAQNGRDTQVRVGASVGIALADDPLTDARTLFGEADAAVYTAKARGRGCFQVFDQELRIRLGERQEQESALIRSVADGDFRLDYTPVAGITSGRQLGWDAQVWWVRPGHDPMPAAGFLPLAQATRRIGDIDRWALGEAVRQVRRWDEAGEDAGLTIAVTLSLARLLEPDLVDDVLAELEGAGLAASRLVLNVPETVLNNGPTLRDRLGALRRAGVLITVDDFGRDAAPLGLLDRAPVDRLRLDPELLGRPEREALLQAVLDVAHAAGLTVVAREVSRPEVLQRLRRAGCDLVQGGPAQPVRSWEHLAVRPT